jgi:hypothetical protein
MISDGQEEQGLQGDNRYAEDNPKKEKPGLRGFSKLRAALALNKGMYIQTMSH